MMSVGSGRVVATVVAHVEENDIEVRKKRLPEHPVTVNRKAVAVRYVKPVGARLGMVPDDDFDSVIHADVKGIRLHFGSSPSMIHCPADGGGKVAAMADCGGSGALPGARDLSVGMQNAA